MDDNKYTEIGSLSKSWGNKGLISAIIFEGYSFLVKPGSFLFLSHDGLFVPYYIENVIPKGNKLQLKFEDIESAESADDLKAKKLFIKEEVAAHVPKKPSKEIDEFLGYTIYNGTERIGKIKHIESMPQQEMAIVDHDENEIMIPLIDALVQHIDSETKQITMSLPEGLLDI